MRKFIDTILNIWKIEELRKRILFTLSLLLVFRIGSYIVIPGVDSEALAAAANSGGGGLADFLALFTGGAFSRASIFALGIMPYISASIIMQLMGIAVPTIQKLQKEESGRRKITQWTRYLTIVICLFQAPAYIKATIPAGAYPETGSWFVLAVTVLVTGCLFVMWLGERITERGIGNGISLLIMIGIIAGLPAALAQEITGRLGVNGGGPVLLLVEMVLLLLVIAVTIMLVQGTRRVTVQFAKRVQGNKQYGGVRNYIPLKVNSAGVMPIIFAQAIMFVPLYAAQWIGDSTPGWVAEMTNIQGFWYNLVFFLMVIVFTYFYTAIMVNPVQLADDMKRNGGFVPGVKPGKKTAEHLDNLLSRITLPGSIFLGLISILPAFAMMFGVKQGFALFYGGTSLLIIVGVLLDTLQQVESHLLMRHYDGLMSSGRIKGKGGAVFGGMTGTSV